jgi:hypothetical protein
MRGYLWQNHGGRMMKKGREGSKAVGDYSTEASVCYVSRPDLVETTDRRSPQIWNGSAIHPRSFPNGLFPDVP